MLQAHQRSKSVFLQTLICGTQALPYFFPKEGFWWRSGEWPRPRWLGRTHAENPLRRLLPVTFSHLLQLPEWDPQVRTFRPTCVLMDYLRPSYREMKLSPWEWIHSLSLFFLNLFYWRTVDLPHCVNFYCTAKWFSYTYILYIYSFSSSFPWWLITGYWIQFLVLYSRTLLFFHPINNSLHLLIPTSQSFPSWAPATLATYSLFYLKTYTSQEFHATLLCFLESMTFFPPRFENLTFKLLKEGNFNQKGILLPSKRMESHNPQRLFGCHVQAPRRPQPNQQMHVLHRHLIITGFWWQNRATERKMLLSFILILCLLNKSVFFLFMKFLFTCSS